MKVLFIISLLISTICFSQKKDSQPQPVNLEEYERAAVCVYRGKYSKHNFREVFSFGQSKTIKLISFHATSNNRVIISEFISDSVHYKFNPDSSYWTEVKVLQDSSFFTLANILYNYQYKMDPPFQNESLCYNPRNAIIFYDAQQKVIAAIEICFECDKMIAFPATFNTGEMCLTKINMIKRLFKSSGIKYGVAVIKE
jgi:hypothetical protein